MSKLLVDVTDGVATLTLNNPAERNTMTAEMVAEITAAMDDAEANPKVGAIVVTGAAPAFCAGAKPGPGRSRCRRSADDDAGNSAQMAAA